MSESESVGAEHGLTVAGAATRRGFLLLGLGLLAGCAKQTTRAMLPNPPWPSLELPPLKEVPESWTRYEPPPAPEPLPQSPSPSWRGTALARNNWAKGDPIPTRMNRMSPIRHITVHHDGMEPFYEIDRSSTASRIEGIRRAHRRRGWGDIGYHLVVDRAGRVWEGRPMGYQGAHVKDHNFANIGIVALGNFDRQRPTPAQLNTVQHLLGELMSSYSVPTSRVRTHQEWASTACPGRYMQEYMNITRQLGRLG